MLKKCIEGVTLDVDTDAGVDITGVEGGELSAPYKSVRRYTSAGGPWGNLFVNFPDYKANLARFTYDNQGAWNQFYDFARMIPILSTIAEGWNYNVEQQKLYDTYGGDISSYKNPAMSQSSYGNSQLSTLPSQVLFTKHLASVYGSLPSPAGKDWHVRNFSKNTQKYGYW